MRKSVAGLKLLPSLPTIRNTVHTPVFAHPASRPALRGTSAAAGLRSTTVIRRLFIIANAVSGLLAPIGTRAQAVDVAGVQVGGTKLQLNGAGVRYKAIFKVCAAGLYLSTRAATPEAAREDFSKSINGIMRMGDVFSTRKKLAAGESFALEWLPGSGTVIILNGKPAGEPIKEPEFYASRMKIWLGNSPADSMLKEALLGKAAKVPGSNANH